MFILILNLAAELQGCSGSVLSYLLLHTLAQVDQQLVGGL